MDTSGVIVVDRILFFVFIEQDFMGMTLSEYIVLSQNPSNKVHAPGDFYIELPKDSFD